MTPRTDNPDSELYERCIPPRLFVGVLVYLAIYLIWLVFGGSADRELIGDFAFLPLTAVAALVSWGAGNRAKRISGLRWGWRLISLALISYGLGDAVQLYYEVFAGQLPWPSLSDAFYLGFYPLFLAGILRFPWGRAGARGRRRQALLDAATIAIGGGTVVWYVVLGPTAYADTGTLLSTIVSVAYPVGDLVLIVALSRLWLGSGQTRLARPLALLSAAVGFFITADLTYSWVLLNSTYTGGSLLDSLWMFATALFVFAAASQPAQQSFEEYLPTQDEGDTFGVAALPYLAVAVVFALLIGSQAKDSFFPGLSLTLTAALVAVLVVARQFLAQRSLTSIYHELREAHAELAALATTDPLTALPNHRALVDAMDRELDRAKRYKRECSLLFIDVDYFKALNDGCGHAAGDTVLNELGEVMLRSLRTIDTLGRWGGEEFVAVLSEVDSDAAMKTAERIRSTVAEHFFDVASGTHITISVGAANYPRDGEVRSELLEAADRAMYTAKRMGRNQIFSAADPTVFALRDGEGTDYELNERATMGAVDALAMLVDTRDKGTGDHVAHVAKLAESVALTLGCSPKQAREVYLAAKLHDIGKVAVADSILRKPGRLTAEEWELMRKHPAVGADVVSRIARLANLAPIIRSHHEHYDGDGYPAGLKGEEIPLEARIVGVADAFDAMISDRPYRKRMTLAEAREELRRCAGSQFDPEVVTALEKLLEGEYERVAAY